MTYVRTFLVNSVSGTLRMLLPLESWASRPGPSVDSIEGSPPGPGLSVDSIDNLSAWPGPNVDSIEDTAP